MATTTTTCRYTERPDHVCVDNQGRPIEGTDKECFYETRADLFDIDPDAD